jgi:hypothetical protein
MESLCQTFIQFDHMLVGDARGGHELQRDGWIPLKKITMSEEGNEWNIFVVVAQFKNLLTSLKNPSQSKLHT